MTYSTPSFRQQFNRVVRTVYKKGPDVIMNALLVLNLIGVAMTGATLGSIHFLLFYLIYKLVLSANRKP